MIDSVHAKYLISYRPPRRVLDEYGYDVEFITKLSTSMFGSGEHHTAYFYRKLRPAPNSIINSTIDVTTAITSSVSNHTRKKDQGQPEDENLLITLPAVDRKIVMKKASKIDEEKELGTNSVRIEEITVYCDPLFRPAIELCCQAEINTFYDHVVGINEAYLNSSRPKRSTASTNKRLFL
jgi:hypothetical protein